ncbi:MAG: type II toxin-antitoxin system VapC family toxin [Terriglobales bacterium]
MNAIVDTGFVVALVNSDDIHHQWALDVSPNFTPPALTCEAVLTEAAFHLHSADLVLEMVESGFLKIAFEANKHISALKEFATRYADRRPDFADLCLVRMSELFPDRVVLTIDEGDFRVYRRNKRDMIPLLCPPKSRH